MLISGVAGRSHPNLNVGDPIPLDNPSKVKEGAKRGWVDSSAPGELNVVSEVNLIGKIEDLGSYPPHYKGIVELKFWRLRLSDDVLFARKSVTVEVLVSDAKDRMGLPDIKVVELKTI